MTETFDEQSALVIVYERLGVLRADEIWLRVHSLSSFGQTTYVAYSARTSTRVDRALAICLRTDGAKWLGEIDHDPCAVA